jgi:hypothetical protein
MVNVRAGGADEQAAANIRSATSKLV